MDRELVIDRIACDGYGMCAELLPELVRLDDWGYPIVRPGPIPDALMSHARSAVEVCPVLAIRLRQAVAVGARGGHAEGVVAGPVRR